MNNNGDSINHLTHQEKEILADMLTPGAVLSFNEKGIIQIFIPPEDLKFISLGYELIQSLESKKLITRTESNAWEVREFTISSEGKRIAEIIRKYSSDKVT